MRTIMLPALLALLVVGCGQEPTGDKAGLRLARMNGCLDCHQLDKIKTGPAWKDVAERYADVTNARQQLIRSVKNGSSDKWQQETGGAVMPPQGSRVSDQHIRKLVDYILSLNDSSASAS